MAWSSRRWPSLSPFACYFAAIRSMGDDIHCRLNGNSDTFLSQPSIRPTQTNSGINVIVVAIVTAVVARRSPLLLCAPPVEGVRCRSRFSASCCKERVDFSRRAVSLA